MDRCNVAPLFQGADGPNWKIPDLFITVVFFAHGNEHNIIIQFAYNQHVIEDYPHIWSTRNIVKQIIVKQKINTEISRAS